MEEAMEAGAWGYVIGSVIGSSLMMLLFFLILLGLLALIPSLRQRFALRNVLAWLISSLSVGYLSGSGGSALSLLVIASVFSAVLVTLRYWYITRKKTTSPT